MVSFLNNLNKYWAGCKLRKYLMWWHGTTLLVVVGVTHGIPGVGVSCPVSHSTIVLGSLHVVVIITMDRIAALAVVLTGWKLGVCPRIRPWIHKEWTHLLTGANIIFLFFPHISLSSSDWRLEGKILQICKTAVWRRAARAELLTVTAACPIVELLVRRRGGGAVTWRRRWDSQPPCWIPAAAQLSPCTAPTRMTAAVPAPGNGWLTSRNRDAPGRRVDLCDGTTVTAPHHTPAISIFHCKHSRLQPDLVMTDILLIFQSFGRGPWRPLLT